MQTRISVLLRKATIYKVSEIFPFVKLYYYEQNEIFKKWKTIPKQTLMVLQLILLQVLKI